MTKPWYNGQWPKLRRKVLARDGYVCQIAYPRICIVQATQADHIVSIEDGGPWWDMSNLRAACRPCNARHRPPLTGLPPSQDW